MEQKNLEMNKEIEEMAKTMVDSDNKEVADALSPFFARLAEALYNAGYRKQEWISVDERSPEETCECLAVSKFGTISLVNYSNRYKAFNAVDDYDDGDKWKFSDVTHWMPLPEAPKMKGGAE